MRLLALFCLLALAACETTAVADSTFPTAALTTGTTDDTLYQIEIRTAPTQPPPRAGATLDVHIADAAGHDVDGVTLEIVPWMAAMNHGTQVDPVITPQGKGHYTCYPLELFMAGTWQLRMKLKKGTRESHVVPTVDVP